MDRPHAYFAYGSNLHPLRLGLRTPTCRLLGAASLAGYALRFHARSARDHSGKADAYGTGNADDVVHGAVYAMSPADFPALDRFEGVGTGAYEVRVVNVAMHGGEREVFIYTALNAHIDAATRPWRWYRDLVVHGAEWLAMPASYVEAIRAVPALEDPDGERRSRHAALLEAMPQWRSEYGYQLP